MKITQPLVTINVVTRNRKAELLRAIKSAYAQTYRPIELIVVDNNSDDGSADAVEERWPDAKVIRLHRNIGCQPGRNIGMANAKGKYIFNLDDDGILERTAIERIVKRFEEEEYIACICAATPPYEAQGDAIDEALPARYAGNFRGGASAIRASALSKTGFFPEYPRAGSEVVLAARMMEHGFEIVHLPQAVMYHPVDRGGKALKDHAYYSGWHNLKTPLQVHPWPGCVFTSMWRFIRGIQYYAIRGVLLRYLLGAGRFWFDLPDVIAGRNSVSGKALRKQTYLSLHLVCDPQHARELQQRGFIRECVDRFKAWRRRKAKFNRGLLDAEQVAAGQKR